MSDHMIDELAARRATHHPATTLDTIADLHGQLLAATADLGDQLMALVERGTPITPSELLALLEDS